MNTKSVAEIAKLKKRIKKLEEENARLKRVQTASGKQALKIIKKPKSIGLTFKGAEKLVADYFNKLQLDPNKASILIDDERYVLMRASSLSIDFLNKIKSLYTEKGEEEAIRIGQNFLFDISHVLGLEDAKAFHKKLNLTDPISKLSVGPVHFAYSGWASVEIMDNKVSPDENFYLKYSHPHSFEADSWVKNNKSSNTPICTMNAGYSSGWCEESFGIALTSVEITCRGKGDDKCVFIMAPPEKMAHYLEEENLNFNTKKKHEIPHFFERKNVEQKINQSLKEKLILLKEVHHRVKNNLQLISSLLNLQSAHLKDVEAIEMFAETKNRIKAIALVHEKLYQSEDVQHVNLQEYLQSIVDLLSFSIGAGCHISINTKSVVNNKISIDKALPCGLILNELISNALKYAFPSKRAGIPDRIIITVIENESEYRVIVQDNGIGLPSDFSLEDTDSLGFAIILALIDQINGKIEFTSRLNKGTSLLISFTV